MASPVVPRSQFEILEMGERNAVLERYLSEEQEVADTDYDLTD